MSPIAGIVAFPDDDGVAFEDAGVDHGVAAHFQREMLALGQQFRRHVDGVELRVWIASIGTPAAMRPITGTLTLCGIGSPSANCGTRPRLPSMTLGRKAARAGRGQRRRHGFRQADDLHRPRPVRQPAQEAALFKSGDQPVDAGFGFEVERLLHLVEGGGNPGSFSRS